MANFLVSNALYWLERYAIDGLRVDAVASMLYLDYSRPAGEWIPNKYGGRENLEAIDFLRRFNTEVFARFPQATTAAEESTAWPQVSRPVEYGGLGFGFKWNMGWMHDTLKYIGKDPIHRKFHHGDTCSACFMRFRRISSCRCPMTKSCMARARSSAACRATTGSASPICAPITASCTAIPARSCCSWAANSARSASGDHDHSLDWHLLDNKRHAGVQKLIRDLNRLYRKLPALHELDCEPSGFEWVVTDDAGGNVFGWIRKGHEARARCLVVINFSPNVYYNYRVRAPFAGRWREVFNSDWRITAAPMSAMSAKSAPWMARRPN